MSNETGNFEHYHLTFVCTVQFVGRVAPGTPAYKSPEEYYDDILALKKVDTHICTYQEIYRNI